MIKVRITFVDNEKGNIELKDSLSTLEKEFEVLNKSRVYKGRNGSQYSNIYLDLEKK